LTLAYYAEEFITPHANSTLITAISVYRSIIFTCSSAGCWRK